MAGGTIVFATVGLLALLIGAGQWLKRFRPEPRSHAWPPEFEPRTQAPWPIVEREVQRLRDRGAL